MSEHDLFKVFPRMPNKVRLGDITVSGLSHNGKLTGNRFCPRSGGAICSAQSSSCSDLPRTSMAPWMTAKTSIWSAFM